MQLNAGSELQNGKYRIIRVLGQGGFGITYLAEHTMLEKKVAIKEFFPKQFCDRENSTSHVTIGTQSNVELVAKLKKRFLKEARNISKLNHPGIINIHDIFEENNSAYYVMDYIEGESLSDIVKREEAMDENRATYYIKKVGEALEYIHSRHMTHFDVKPANIMVRKNDDFPILIDFGLSKQYNESGEATTTGLTGVSKGFSAIELTNLSEVTTFSEQSDVYSLGATLLYLLTGTIPPDASALVSGSEELAFPNGLSDNLKKAITSAMEVNRKKRCKNVKEFLEIIGNEKGSYNDLNYNDDTGCENSDDLDDSTRILEENAIEANTPYSIISQEDGTTDITETPDQSVDTDAYDTDENLEYQPSKWDKLITNITSTNRLIDTYSVSNSRKTAYFASFVFVLLLSGCWGLIIWLFAFKRIQGAMKKLFFPDNLSDWEYGADYSKAKAIGIVGFLTILPIVVTIIIIYFNRDDSSVIDEYITETSAQCPFYMGDVQVSTVNNVKGEIVFTCHAYDSLNINRNRINELNVELLKPIFIQEDSKDYNIAKKHNIVFQFYNNKEKWNTVTLTPQKIKDYKNLSIQERGEKYIDSYVELMGNYLPLQLDDKFWLRGVSIENNFGDNSNNKCIVYHFDDDSGINWSKDVGLDSLQKKVVKFIPINDFYFKESVINSLDGIGFKVFSGKYGIIENLLYKTHN